MLEHLYSSVPQHAVLQQCWEFTLQPPAGLTGGCSSGASPAAGYVRYVDRSNRLAQQHPASVDTLITSWSAWCAGPGTGIDAGRRHVRDGRLSRRNPGGRHTRLCSSPAGGVHPDAAAADDARGGCQHAGVLHPRRSFRPPHRAVAGRCRGAPAAAPGSLGRRRACCAGSGCQDTSGSCAAKQSGCSLGIDVCQSARWRHRDCRPATGCPQPGSAVQCAPCSAGLLHSGQLSKAPSVNLACFMQGRQAEHRAQPTNLCLMLHCRLVAPTFRHQRRSKALRL